MIHTSDNKKYYYLKLKDNFYETDELRILESMPNGYMYSNLLLKLYLKSLKHEGKLQLNEFIPYNPQMIATITNLNVDIVTAGLKVMEQLKLIEVLPDGTIYMIQIQNYIGQSSSEADRKRDYRQKIENERQNLLNEGQTEGQNEDKCPKEVDKNPPEKEIELEKEIEIKNNTIPYQEIVKYLNEKAGTKYRHTTKATQEKIKARWNEKFVLDDFKTVIDNKVADWKGKFDKEGKSLEDYLRPETLFGTKFEGYLNQKGGNTNGQYGFSGQQNKGNSTGKWAGFKPKQVDYGECDFSDPDIM